MLFSAMLHPGACLSILLQLQTDTSGKLCPPAALPPHSEPGGEEEEEESRLLSPLPELTLGWPSSQHLELKLQPSAGLCCPKRCAVEQHRLPDGAGEFEEGEGARGEDLASGRAGDVGGGQIVSALPHTAAAVCISSSCILGKGDGTTCRRKTPFQNAQPVSEDVTPSSTIVKPQPLSPITPGWAEGRAAPWHVGLVRAHLAPCPLPRGQTCQLCRGACLHSPPLHSSSRHRGAQHSAVGFTARAAPGAAPASLSPHPAVVSSAASFPKHQPG